MHEIPFVKDVEVICLCHNGAFGKSVSIFMQLKKGHDVSVYEIYLSLRG